MAAETANSIRRVHLRFVGWVQGVGFRWTSQSVAEKLGLTGWVRNELDGSVTMELQGPDEKISQFFTDLILAYKWHPIHYSIDEKEDIDVIDGDKRFSVLL